MKQSFIYVTLCLSIFILILIVIQGYRMKYKYGIYQIHIQDTTKKYEDHFQPSTRQLPLFKDNTISKVESQNAEVPDNQFSSKTMVNDVNINTSKNNTMILKGQTVASVIEGKRVIHNQSAQFGHNVTVGDSQDIFDGEESFKGAFCVEKNMWNQSSILGPVVSNMSAWDYKRNGTCTNVQFNASTSKTLRPNLILNCDTNRDSPGKVEMDNSSNEIYVAEFGNTCLNEFIDTHGCCKGQQKVPNVVHYVWYTRNSLDFMSFMSILSVVRFVNPCFIIFHGDRLPSGKYWDFLTSITHNIIHLKRQKPNSVFGQHFQFKQHASDIMRIEALLMYGGIYMDTDTVIVKSIDTLRQYPCVMSTQSGSLLGSAFIMAERNATFLNMWLEGYKTNYKESHYYYNAMIYPRQLADNHTDLIHVEDGTISRPKDLYVNKPHDARFKNYDWSKIYGMHLFTRIARTKFNENTIKSMKSVSGAILRHVLFGNKDICH